MLLTMRMRTSTLVLALMIGILAAAMGLMVIRGASLAFAQADTTAPTIWSVAITSDPDEDDSYLGAYAVGRSGGSIVQSSTWASGVYRIGDDVKVTLTFSENVTITGSPQLELAIGSNNRTADYESSAGSAAVFTYTVAEDDTDSDGIAIAANKLTLNGGSIKDMAENDATLTHNALAAQDGHKVDGVRPTLTGLYFGSSSGGSDGAYTAGEILLIRAEFTEGPIHGSVSGPPQVKLDFDSGEKAASWDNSLRFNDDRIWVTYFGYVVQEGDLDKDGPAISANSFDLNGGFIRDTAGNDAVLTHSVVAAGSSFIVDAVAPTVSSIAITSDPGDDDTYGTGDKIEVTVTFSENMSFPRSITCSPNVVHCKAELELDIGGTARTAAYQSHNGAEAVYAYTVQAGDTDDNGIAIGANKLTGLLIKDAAGTNGTGINDADLSHDSVTDDAGHKVSGASSSVIFSGDTTINFEENGEGSVATYTLAGSDDAITWSLSGEDSDDFSLASESATRRELKFTSSPNYEDPTDADTDNQYDVTIQASDGANTSTLQVTVLVTNVLHDADELPVITGTVQVGETLTVDTSPIPDTSQDTTFGYAWIRTDGATDTYIDGATSSSYTLTDDDEGKTIKVLVGFRTTEGRYRLTSAPTEPVAAEPVAAEPNSPASGTLTISGTVQVGETLTAHTSGISDADGLTNVSYSYHWIRNDGNTSTEIAGETASTYTLVSADEGRNIRVRVSFTDDAGNNETISSAATAAVAANSDPPANTPATGEPTISGTAQVGETLTVDTSGISDADGLTKVSFSYQWIRGEGGTDTGIAGQTSSTYTLVSVDEGKTIKVKVSFTDDEGNDEERTSPATAAVSVGPGPLTGFTLVDASDQSVLWEHWTDGSALTLDDPDNGSYGIRVDVESGEDIRRVRLQLSGAKTVGKAEGIFPYSLYGDGGEDALNGDNLPTGDYVLKATAYSEGDAVLGRLQVSFTVEATPANNNPATGAPSIGGTAEVSRTLTAYTWGIRDIDGLNDAAFEYQWVKVTGTTETDISGATGESYKLVAADEGKTIKVQVSFTDDAGFTESLESQPTSVVTVFEPLLSALSVSPGTLTPSFDSETSRYTIPDLSSAESRITLTVTAKAGRPVVFVKAVSAVQACPIQPVSCNDWDYHDAEGNKVDPLTDTDTDASGFQVDNDVGETKLMIHVHPEYIGEDEAYRLTINRAANSLATSQPAIGGTAQVGKTLTTSTSDIADADGLDNVSFSYQWIAGGTDIDGATGSSYSLTANEQAQTIQVRVSFTDDANNEETLTSVATVAVAAAPNRSATGKPTIGGTPQVDQTLTADTANIADQDGLTNVSYRYQWIRNDGSADTDIQDAAGSSYTLVDADAGKTIKVQVTFTDDAGHEETLTSTATASVEARPNSPATGAPTVSGTVQFGETLTVSTSGIADTDGLTNVSYSYQWIRNDGSADTDIQDAAGSSYTLVDADAGKTIKVKVTFTDDGGDEETLTSAPTAAVAATVPGAPGGLSVSVNDTGKLDVSWSAPESNGGSAITGYRVQWKEAADSWNTPADVSETTVTGTNHTVAGLTDGVEYTFRVFAVNSAGDSTASGDESGTPRETSAPTVSSGTVDGAALTLTFSEGLTETPLPAVATFTVNVGGNQRGVSSVAISGSTVTLTLASAVTSTDDVSVGYTVPSDAAAARLKDLSDNPAESFTGQAVANSTAAAQPPLTASIHDEPSSHDGQKEFTFELRFSENLEGFSYKTLRDNAFTVTGGKVEGARRLVSGSNIEWQIKILPTSNGDVTIVLPITTVCTADGAICTGDGIKLSNRLELTVSGPTSQQSSQQQENTPATGSPTISGTVQVAETLTALTSGISDSDGTTNTSYTYQWIANEGTSDSDIADATASTYALVDGDAGKTIKVQVAFTDDAGNEETLTSAATAAVEARPNSPATGSPTISGTVQVRETLTVSTSGIADTDGLTNVSYSYQWTRNDGSTDTDIQDATGSDYTLVDADEGKTIKVQVTFTDDAGHEETLTSAATAAVGARPNSPATGAPTISGTVQVRETLTASTSGIADTDGLTNVSYSYQWIRNDGSADTVIQGAAGSSYSLVDADEGKTIKVKVSFTDDAGNEETLTSAASASVAGAPEPITVILENNPASHNGTDEFTFQIRFSEHFKLSYKTLRDHAFTVVEGTVKKAQRQVKGSNIGWTITVEPASNAEVEIVLPATTDCDATGAICTADGRKLSNSLDFTVVGPGE